MAPLIDINLDDIPDEMPVLGIGNRTFVIKDVRDETNDRGDEQTIVELELTEPNSEENGMKKWDRFSFKHENPYIRSLNLVRFKELCRSAGFTGAKPDSSDLITCTVTGVVKPNNYTNASGEAIQDTKIGKYLHD